MQDYKPFLREMITTLVEHGFKREQLGIMIAANIELDFAEIDGIPIRVNPKFPPGYCMGGTEEDLKRMEDDHGPDYPSFSV